MDWDKYFLQGFENGYGISVRQAENARDRKQRADEVAAQMKRDAEHEGRRAAEREAALATDAKRYEEGKAEREAARNFERDYREKQLALHKAESDANNQLRMQAAAEKKANDELRTWAGHYAQAQQEAENMSPEELAAGLNKISQLPPEQQTPQMKAAATAFGATYRAKRNALANPSQEQEVTGTDAEGNTVKTKRRVNLPGVQLPGLEDAAANPTSVAAARAAAAKAPAPAEIPSGTQAIIDGLSGRMDSFYKGNAAKLAEHSKELAQGDERYGFLNLGGNRRTASDEINKALTTYDADKKLFDWARANASAPEAAAVFEKLNKKY